MHNCPPAGKWAISVWEGPDATAPDVALALCGPDAVDAAYSLDAQTGAWSRWFAGKPDVSNLPPLDDAQGVLALGSSTAAATSEQPLTAAQTPGQLQHCPPPGKWSIAAWEGATGTAASDALATCGEGAVSAAYHLDPQTGTWSRWFAGKPEVSNLPALDNMQGVIALGSGFVSAQVSAAEGGTVAVPGGPSLTIPAHALSADTTVTMAVALSDGASPAFPEWMRSAGHAVQIDLGGAQLTADATLIIPYDQSSLSPGATGDSVFVAYFDDAADTWVPVDAELDISAQTLTAHISHASWWGPWTWSDVWADAWKATFHAVLSLDPLQIVETATANWGCVESPSSVLPYDGEARNLITNCVLRDDPDHPDVRVMNKKVFILEVWADDTNAIPSTLGKTFLGPSDKTGFTIDFSNAWGGDFETVFGAYTCSAFLAQAARMALLALPGGNLVPVEELAKVASHLEEDPNIAVALQDCQGGDLVNALAKVGEAFVTGAFAGALQETLSEVENDVLKGVLERTPEYVIKDVLVACLPIVNTVSLPRLAIELADIVSMGEDWRGTVKFTSNKVMRPRTVIPTPTPTSTPTPTPTPGPGPSGRIAFTSNRDGLDQIFVMNSDGSGQTRLTNDSAQDWGPDWSPDGSEIAFTSNRAVVGVDIYVINADGSGQTRVTDNPATYWDDGPAWSPDGAKIAFASIRDGSQDVYVMPADGSSETRLTTTSGGDEEPAWSPDGSKIAFTSSRDWNNEIYAMNADGTQQMNLSNNAWIEHEPAWSPDGSRIAFTSTRDGNNEIYVMNADGTDQTRLTNNSADDRSPAWSPDGSNIAFASDRDGNYEIYVMNADGSGQTNVTNDPGHDTTPAWSP
jgi:hypothetical protein